MNTSHHIPVKIAGAPISWGVCEVPDWGYQLSPERVLTEMNTAGLSATELGPEGFLPSDPAELTALLDRHNMACVGTFAPVVLHRSDYDPVNSVHSILDSLAAVGASTLVLAAATGTEGYDSSSSSDSRPKLDERQWRTLMTNLDRLGRAAAERGITAVLHPHMGTLVQTKDEVDRILSGSITPLCLDTGHLLIGGTDPLQLAKTVPGRIAHVHLKDVNAALAEQVRSGELTYTQAVAQGLYTPLGSGDVNIAEIVSTLRRYAFEGWFVLEQDTILADEPQDQGPLGDVLTSLSYLRDVLESS